jgi:serine protease AprX
MSAPQFDAEEVRAARAGLGATLGSRMAEKASDAYCLAVTRRQRTVGAEAFGLTRASGPAAAATVVEFRDESPVPALPRLTERPDWPREKAAVESLLREQPSGAPVRFRTALRQKFVEDARAAGYRSVAEVYQEIERLSGGMLRPRPEVLGDPQIPTAVNQVCWLNHTVRTFAAPEALAEVAAADSVTAFDVPRRLRADADVANHRCIDLPDFQDRTGSTGRGVTVAVIDGEVALTHPALAGRVVQRRNHTPESWGNPSPHGTAVAGIVGAADPTDAGIAPEVLIYGYKVLATAPAGNGDDFSGALAIQQALEDGADVANCSWGAGPTGDGTSREARAATTAWALGLVVVKSAGNRGPGAGTMTTPADAAGILVVGATGLDCQRVEDYSSRGPAGSRPGPDVVAPGGGDAGRIRCCAPGGGFGDAGAGTSYAAPHVSGVAALYLQADPDLVPDQVRDRLRADARPLGIVPEAAQGAGLVCVR